MFLQAEKLPFPCTTTFHMDTFHLQTLDVTASTLIMKAKTSLFAVRTAELAVITMLLVLIQACLAEDVATT